MFPIYTSWHKFGSEKARNTDTKVILAIE